ncbi:hypothetical protein BASA81_007907 [Batrachochytrium salamandrivorans]|nr:hypothetical protein BASA81_007907 [Batrachochytrium salamandrivorans]
MLPKALSLGRAINQVMWDILVMFSSHRHSPDKSMPQVFVSHSWEGGNHQVCLEINKQLASRGLDTWFESREDFRRISPEMVQAVYSSSSLNAGKLEFQCAMGRAALAKNFVCVAVDQEALDLISAKGSVFAMYLGHQPKVFNLANQVQGEQRLKTLAEIAFAIKSSGHSARPMVSMSINPPTAQPKPMPDGSQITLDVDGGHLKLLPSGVKIRQFVDGSTRQLNTNGTTIDINPDESLVIQTNPDGTVHETNLDKQTTSWLPDGTVLRDFGHGNIRQDGPDGIAISRLANGSKVQTDWHSRMESTEFADGTVDQVDDVNGTRLKISKDGKITPM